jgi:nitrogen-specific signal transduction histidine kinase
MNLCTNPSHAMREEGGILEVGRSDSESGYLDMPPVNYLRLTVSDTGQGITSGMLKRIFEPYFTTKEKGEGTGLGLSVVHGIAKNYGGIVTAYSELGKGSTFHAYLPVMQEKAEVPRINEVGPIPTEKEHISEEKAKAMGIRAFVMKPVVIRGLADNIRKVLDKS